jgi:hypothetical protein
LLENAGEAGVADGQMIAAGREAKKSEVTVGVGFFGLGEIGIEVSRFDDGIGDATAALIDNVALDGAGGGLRLRIP